MQVLHKLVIGSLAIAAIVKLATRTRTAAPKASQRSEAEPRREAGHQAEVTPRPAASPKAPRRKAARPKRRTRHARHERRA